MSFRVLGDSYSYLGRSIGKGGAKNSAPNQLVTFEGGLLVPNPTGFDAVAGVLANLAVRADAAMRGNLGLRVTTAGVGSESYGQLTDPNQNRIISLKWLFNQSNMVMAVGNAFNIVLATSPGAGGVAFILTLLNNGGIQSIQGLARNDAGANVFTTVGALPANNIEIVVLWCAASAVGANDGKFNIYANGTLVTGRTDLDNDTHSVNGFDIGARSGVDAATSGYMNFDQIEWYDRFIRNL